MTLALTSLESAGIIVAIVSGIAGLLFGLGGLILGALNYHHQRQTTMPRLQVHVAMSIPIGITKSGRHNVLDPVPTMTIRNTGHVPTVAAGIGFCIRGAADGGNRAAVLAPEPADLVPWPRQLDAGHAVVLRLSAEDLGGLLQQSVQLKRAYVITSDERIFYSPRRPVRYLAEQLKNRANA